MRYKRAALGLLLVLCFALSACDSANKAVEVADSATETVQAGLDTSRFLRIVDGNPDTVDPQCTSGYYNVALNVFDRLVEVRVDADGNSTIAPSLAKTWEISEDGRTYAFTLQEGVRFSNGAALTSADVGYTLRRLLTHPESRNGDIASQILGAAELRAGGTDVLSGFAELDDYRFAITLSEPCAAFLACLATPGASILDEETTEAAGGRFGREAEATVGTGPFIFREWQKDEHQVLVANPDCWCGTPRCEGIVVFNVSDPETCRRMYEEGALDILDLESLGDDAEYFIHGDIYQPLLQQGYRVGITYVALNEAVEPLDDARVRKAMQLALDRDSIMRVACNGRGSVENGILPRGLIGHNPVLPEIPFDQEWAKRLLTEAGFEDGFELPMVMPDTANQSMRDVMNLLIFMWRRVGIYARVAYVSEEEFIEQRSAGQIACYAATWSADFNDPDNFMYTFFGSQANTRRHGLCYGNAGEMARVASARSIVNEADRVAEYQALEQAIIQQDAAWIPLYSRQHYFAVSKRVDGFRVSWNGWSSNRYSDVAVLEEQ